MEGAVYDISDWAACQSDNLKHLQANTHSVQYRIVSGKKNPTSKNNAADFPRYVFCVCVCVCVACTHKAKRESD